MPKTVTGLAAPLPLVNVATDVIIPKRFLITVLREELADGTFADLRFDDAGATRPDFVLNRAPWDKSTILIVGDNFGCGSSREHAVWGMRRLGLTAAIGTGFAGIFYDNARKIGLVLPIVIPEARDQLMKLAASGSGIEITIDVEACMITAGDLTVPFQMDDAAKAALVRGRDYTLDSLEYADAIRAFEAGLTDKMRVSVIK